MLRLALPALLASCAYPRLDEAPPTSLAAEVSAATDIGQRVLETAPKHPGASGLFVLRTGLGAFAARATLIDAAQEAVDAQYYIFHDDLTGRWLLSRLLAAADRGVRVRLLLDDLGSAGIDDLITAADVHPRFEVRLFNPCARGPLPGLARVLDLVARARRLNHRMHNKLLAVDGAASIVGGRNVGDEYFDAHQDVNFGDLDLLAFGPVTHQVEGHFDLYWNSPFAIPLSAWPSLGRSLEDLADLRAELLQHERENAGSQYGQRLRRSDFVTRALAGDLPLIWAPTTAVTDLPEKIVAVGDEVRATMLIERLGDDWPPSTRDLVIISPYFVPRRKGVEHLTDMVDEGVHVRVLTNSLAATDVPAVHAGYKAHRRGLLEGGVELFELRPSGELVMEGHKQGLLGSSSASLHAKTFVSDNRRVFVGSLNLDPRSTTLNTELGFVVDSPELATRITESFERVTAPEVSWHLGLEGNELVWRGEQDGEPIRLDKEPGAGWWTRCLLTLLGWLPIEGQL